MNIPSNKFKVEDFPDQKDWIGKLFFVMNPFITTVSSTVNSNLTFGHNIMCQDIALNITPGNGTFPLFFKNNLPVRPASLVVCNATEDGNPVILSVAWAIDNQNRITITDIALIKAGVISSISPTSTYKSLLRMTP